LLKTLSPEEATKAPADANKDRGLSSLYAGESPSGAAGWLAAAIRGESTNIREKVGRLNWDGTLGIGTFLVPILIIGTKIHAAELFKVIETEIMSLHDGNIARFRIRPSEFEEWQRVQ